MIACFMDIKKTLEQEKEIIDLVIASVCRNKSISSEMSDDFKGYIYEKLLINDGKRLRDYQGTTNSTWKSYLSVVINRLAIDFIKKHWGRWENSAIAKHLGKVAMMLETLIYRDGRTFSEASQFIMTNPEFTLLYRLSAAEFLKIKKHLPNRVSDKLELHLKETLYPKNEFFNKMDELLTNRDKSYLQKVMQVSRVRLEMTMLEDWDLKLQGRIPSRKSSNISSRDQLGDEVLDQVEDNSTVNPLSSLLKDEVQSHLENEIDSLLAEQTATDLMIVSMYLVDGLHISEIARTMSKPTEPMKSITGKRKVSSQAWKRIDKRISRFTNELKTRIENLQIAKEDREMIIQLCYQYIVKKMEKNINPVVYY